MAVAPVAVVPAVVAPVAVVPEAVAPAMVVPEAVAPAMVVPVAVGATARTADAPHERHALLPPKVRARAGHHRAPTVTYRPGPAPDRVHHRRVVSGRAAGEPAASHPANLGVVAHHDGGHRLAHSVQRHGSPSGTGLRRPGRGA